MKIKTVALDTNAILSFRLKRHPHFKEVEKKFQLCLDKKVKIYIALAVFLEMEWVLRSFYEQPKEQIIDFFQELLLIEYIVVKDRKQLDQAIMYYCANNISFTDCVILSEIKNLNPDTFLTFDKDLEKIFIKG